MTPEQKQAGRTGLDLKLNAFIAAAPFYERGAIQKALTDDVRDAIVEAVGEPLLAVVVTPTTGDATDETHS